MVALVKTRRRTLPKMPRTLAGRAIQARLNAACPKRERACNKL
jgi:hypothetical protein